jgi:predicted HNH restriction endonuclease
MGKKLLSTPRSRVRSALRMVFLRSRERAAALKREGNCCEACGVKASVAKGKEVKVEVHHRKNILNWEKIIDLVFEQLLCDPSNFEVLCKPCHDLRHEKEATS